MGKQQLTCEAQNKTTSVIRAAGHPGQAQVLLILVGSACRDIPYASVTGQRLETSRSSKDAFSARISQADAHESRQHTHHARFPTQPGPARAHSAQAGTGRRGPPFARRRGTAAQRRRGPQQRGAARGPGSPLAITPSKSFSSGLNSPFRGGAMAVPQPLGQARGGAAQPGELGTARPHLKPRPGRRRPPAGFRPRAALRVPPCGGSRSRFPAVPASRLGAAERTDSVPLCSRYKSRTAGFPLHFALSFGFPPRSLCPVPPRAAGSGTAGRRGRPQRRRVSMCPSFTPPLSDAASAAAAPALPERAPTRQVRGARGQRFAPRPGAVLGGGRRGGAGTARPPWQVWGSAPGRPRGLVPRPRADAPRGSGPSPRCRSGEGAERTRARVNLEGKWSVGSAPRRAFC